MGEVPPFVGLLDMPMDAKVLGRFLAQMQ